MNLPQWFFVADAAKGHLWNPAKGTAEDWIAAWVGCGYDEPPEWLRAAVRRLTWCSQSMAGTS